MKLEHTTSTEIITTGLPALDKLFMGGGYYRGNCTLITGSSGTAKTILASYFALNSCQRQERVLYFSFEESPNQLIRNVLSVGIDLKPFIESKLLLIHSSRPSLHGLEMHLLSLHKYIREFKPQTVIIDPISSLVTVGSKGEVRAMLARLMDMLKVHQISALFTSLTNDQTISYSGSAEEAIFSLVDTWIKVRNEESKGDRIRSLYIVKSRGMGHSSEVKDFIVTDKGISITEVNSMMKKSKRPFEDVETLADVI